MMEHESKDIITMVTVDKHETGLKSVCMEKEFMRALASVEEAGVIVVEVVTDGHTHIAAQMKSKYSVRIIAFII